jgi:hypothetical protein
VHRVRRCFFRQPILTPRRRQWLTTAIIKSFATAKFVLAEQAPNVQTPTLQTARGQLEAWSLKILWRLDFGIWSFSVR